MRGIIIIKFLLIYSSLFGQTMRINGTGRPTTINAPGKASSVNIIVAQPPIISPPFQVVIIGNSTIAAYLGQNEVGSYLFTPEEITAGCSYTSLAVPGHTILQQNGAWSGLSNKTSYEVALLQIGLNDMAPGESAATALARYQALIDDIRADAPDITIITCKMLPCRQRWIDLYGGTNGPIAYQKQLDMNDAMMGIGPNAITGMDATVSDHYDLLSDGSGNLDAAYDMGDHIHENNAGRQVIAGKWRQALEFLVYLPLTE